MENKQCLLKASSVDIIPNLTVRIPTVGEILDDENGYYGIASSLTAAPFQYMVQLDDMGVDYTSINDWDLFRMLLIRYSRQELMCKIQIKELEKKINDNSLQSDSITEDYKQLELLKNMLHSQEKAFNLVLKDFHLTSEIDNKIFGFDEYHINDSDEVVLYNPVTKVEINRLVYNDLAETIRKINLFEKVNSKPGNESARKYLLEKERKKQKRNAKKSKEPYLENLVIALVNTSEFPYNYESCMDLSIYKFNQSLKQIQHKIAFDNTMVGVYAGTVDTSKMNNKDALSWIVTK